VKNISASKLERAILEEFLGAWEKNPDPGGYYPLDDIWRMVYGNDLSKKPSHLDVGVLNNLLHRGYIESISAPDGEILAHLTDAGKGYLEKIQEASRTRKIALLGAFTGSLGLLVSILKIIIDSLSK
jgi:hypothetical protein